MIWNLLFNIILPTLILTKLSGESALGTKMAIVVALAFPIAYGMKDFASNGKINFFSALGIINVSLTGGISLLELDASYIAIKEATIPTLFGLAVLISVRTPYPLINTLIFNELVMKVDKIRQSLKERNNTASFERAMTNANYIVSGSFFLSAILNYGLARYLLTSPPGTEAFNQELGRMTALSYPVIALPSTAVLMLALWYLFHKIHQLTGLELEDIVNT
ncbi:MAG: MFS transporter [Pseudomonadales bacterium]|nr:MFS transporter [Pseudomonadales bacterium]